MPPSPPPPRAETPELPSTALARRAFRDRFGRDPTDAELVAYTQWLLAWVRIAERRFAPTHPLRP